MKLGLLLRSFGPAATRETLAACAETAEARGVAGLWVTDHVAIPPDDAEGSGGRYLDPLATLAFVAARTERIAIGTSVLVVPYRPALPTAKAIATVQELSNGRLRLGAAAGWMEAEFRALGVRREDRGAITDDTLAFLHEAFSSDEVERNGQRFLFRPRPTRPPILVGGNSDAAIRRAVRHGDGWMPMAKTPDAITESAPRYLEAAREAGNHAPSIVVLTSLPLDDLDEARRRIEAFADLGVDELIVGARYDDAAGFDHVARTLVEDLPRA